MLMRTYVHHDQSGEIRALIHMNAPPGVTMMLAPKAGHLVAEVESLEVDARDVDALREIAKNHRIEPSAAALVKKEG